MDKLQKRLIGKHNLKKYFIFAGLLLLTGCKESPDADIVVNKNENQLEKKITEKSSETVAREKTIEKKKDEFIVATGDVNVIVNANVSELTGSFPVVKVKPHEITSEELKMWGDVLFGGAKAYDPGAPKSKKEIEEEILQWKQWLAQAKEDGQEDMILPYESGIKNLEKAYEKAPDNAQRKEVEYVFHPGPYYWSETDDMDDTTDSSVKDMNFRAETDAKDTGGVVNMIYATNRNETDYSEHSLSWFEDTWDEVFQDEKFSRYGMKCTQEEAFALAEQTKKQLGLEEWVLYDADDGCKYGCVSDYSCGHSFCFVRRYGEIPTLTGLEIDLLSDELYAANLDYEKLCICVQNGKVSSVELETPMDIIEVENDNAAIMTFDEVYECFKSQMISQYSKNTYESWYGDEEECKKAEVSIHISKIEEGMLRIKMKDSSDEYRMVPAWIFKGSTLINHAVMLQDEVYVAVNAIDGSIINTTLGY